MYITVLCISSTDLFFLILLWAHTYEMCVNSVIDRTNNDRKMLID